MYGFKLLNYTCIKTSKEEVCVISLPPLEISGLVVTICYSSVGIPRRIQSH